MNDPMMEGALIVLGCTAGIVLLALFFSSLQEKRTREVAQAGEEMGFSFHKEEPTLAAEVFGPIEGLRVVNVLRGEAQGLKVAVFDVHRAVQARDTVIHVRLTMLAFIDDESTWPAFALHPRRYKRFLSWFTGESSQMFEDDPAFSQYNTLAAVETEPVREMFTEDVRRYFAQNPGQWVEGNGRLLIRTKGRLIAAKDLRSFLEEGFLVRNLLESGERKME
jgi:hypothetical protein